jgi:hypothetical protein
MYQCKSIPHVLIFIKAQLVLSLSPPSGCLFYMCLIIADVTRQTKEGSASQWGHTDARLITTPDNELRCDLARVESAQQGDLRLDASPIPP